MLIWLVWYCKNGMVGKILLVRYSWYGRVDIVWFKWYDWYDMVDRVWLIRHSNGMVRLK